MSLSHPWGLKLLPQKLKSIPFLEHIHKFNLDFCSSIYNNSPQVSYLGMNPGRGWNPNLEGSYLLEYRKSKDELILANIRMNFGQSVNIDSILGL